MNQNSDMTTGPILPQLLRFAFPILLTSILQQSYSMADAVIIQRLAGLDGFTAIGATGAILWIIESMLMGLAHGFGVVFAQAAGSAQEKDTLGAAALRAGLMAFSLAAAASMAILLFDEAILLLFHTPLEILLQACAYLKSMTPFCAWQPFFR